MRERPKKLCAKAEKVLNPSIASCPCLVHRGFTIKMDAHRLECADHRRAGGLAGVHERTDAPPILAYVHVLEHLIEDEIDKLEWQFRYLAFAIAAASATCRVCSGGQDGSREDTACSLCAALDEGCEYKGPLSACELLKLALTQQCTPSNKPAARSMQHAATQLTLTQRVQRLTTCALALSFVPISLRPACQIEAADLRLTPVHPLGREVIRRRRCLHAHQGSERSAHRSTDIDELISGRRRHGCTF